MPAGHESPSGTFKPQTGLRSKCRVFSAARARRFRCAAAGRGLFSFGTKREPERTAVPGGHESPSGTFKPQTGLRSKCRVFSAARARRFRCAAAGRGLFSFGTKREPERTAVPGGHESPSGAFKPQTGLRSKCRVFSAARARRFRCAAAGRGLFSFGTKREPERTAVPGGHESPSGAFKPQTGLRSKCRVFSAARARRFRRAGPTRKGLLAPFNPKEDGLHTKKLAASLNAFLRSAISRPLSRCGGSSPQGSRVRPLRHLR